MKALTTYGKLIWGTILFLTLWLLAFMIYEGPDNIYAFCFFAFCLLFIIFNFILLWRNIPANEEMSHFDVISLYTFIIFPIFYSLVWVAFVRGMDEALTLGLLAPVIYAIGYITSEIMYRRQRAKLTSSQNRPNN